MSAAREIALALAGRRAQRLPGGAYLVCCPVPSHGRGLGDRNPSLRLADGDVCLLVHCYSGCDHRDILDALRRRGLLDDHGRNRPDNVSFTVRAAQNGDGRKREDDDRARISRAREISGEARDPRGTRGEDYLCSRRLVLDDDLAGRVLRFHPRCPWRNKSTGKIEFLPALIVPFRSFDNDEITGIHRIRLDQPQRWPKAERRMLGVVYRAAVKLDGDVGDVLAIGEGIETCMAARVLGIRPAWALGSAGSIERFPVLPGINTLRILAENDDGTNEKAVDLCGLRWHAASRRVRVIKPDLGFNDLNDVLRGDIL